MKKRLIMLLLVVFCLTLNAAYSAELDDGNSTDSLNAVSEIDLNQDQLSSQMNDDVLSSSDEQAIGSSYEKDYDDCSVSVHDYYYDKKHSTFVSISFNTELDGHGNIIKQYDIKGNLTIEIDGDVKFNKDLDAITIYDREGSYLVISQYEVINDLADGFHTIKVKNIWNGGERTLISTTFKATYYFKFGSYTRDMTYGAYQRLRIFVPKDTTGNITVTYNGKSQKVSYENGEAKFTVSYKDLNIGFNKIEAKLTGDSKYPELYDSINFEMKPQFLPDIYRYCVSKGEKDHLTVKVPKAAGGTFIIYNSKKVLEWDNYWQESIYCYHKGSKVLASAKVVNGKAKIPVSKLKVGNNRIFLVYKKGGYTYQQELWLIVAKNSPKIKVSLSAKSIYEGGKIKASIKSPKLKSDGMSLMIDGKLMKDISLTKGKASKIISKLKPGTHNVKFFIYVEGKKLFYSKTFKIKVKEKITIKSKNIVVKKAEKKFKLTATLKIKGKLAKSKKIVFKINDKKYKVKTNKKGVAKLTLKKSKLKDLGKNTKIKYQVSYGQKAINRYLTLK